MGKKNGSSWLTAVKRAFRSPTKKEQNTPHGNEIEEDDEKKREKRRWLFRKPAIQESPVRSSGISPPPPQESDNANSKTFLETAPRKAMTTPSNAGKSQSAVVSVATSASPANLPRLTRRVYYARENYAAVVIQTSFRGYLVSKSMLFFILCLSIFVLYADEIEFQEKILNIAHFKKSGLEQQKRALQVMRLDVILHW